MLIVPYQFHISLFNIQIFQVCCKYKVISQIYLSFLLNQLDKRNIQLQRSTCMIMTVFQLCEFLVLLENHFNHLFLVLQEWRLIPSHPSDRGSNPVHLVPPQIVLLVKPIGTYI